MVRGSIGFAERRRAMCSMRMEVRDRRGNLDPDRESGPVATRFMGGMAAEAAGD